METNHPFVFKYRKEIEVAKIKVLAKACFSLLCDSLAYNSTCFVSTAYDRLLGKVKKNRLIYV